MTDLDEFTNILDPKKSEKGVKKVEESSNEAVNSDSIEVKCNESTSSTSPKKDLDSPQSESKTSKKSTEASVRNDNRDPVKDYLENVATSLSNLLSRTLKIENKPNKLETVDLGGVAKYLSTCKNVIFMTGAGISTSAGIPDFRSPVTGLYANLSKYNLPFPEAVFDLNYFYKNPQPFYTLSKELMPKNYRPTVSHYFQRLLVQKGHVHKIYTQNIDALEAIAQIPKHKVIAAHGSFEVGHCIGCGTKYPFEWMKNRIEETEYLRCENEDCLEDTDTDDSLKIVKPDITFFGEELPTEFTMNCHNDLKKCDLLIVMGTSLKVQPFGLLPQLVNKDCPRLLINRELVGDFFHSVKLDPDSNYRDVFLESSCDDGCLALAKLLGYHEELKKLMKDDYARIDKLSEA